MDILEVEHLTVRYPDQPEPVLREISFRVRTGENMLVLGPSGSGKSTLALALNGMIPHAVEAEVEGDVRWNGCSVLHTDMQTNARAIGILFQDPESQFCMLTAEDEVAFGLENLRIPREQMRSRIEQGLALTGIPHVRNRRISDLSGGMKQRLGLSCLLAMEQPVIILDEPTAHLDPTGADDVFAVLDKLAYDPGRTLVIIEHRLDEWVKFIDRVLVIAGDGTLLYDEPPRILFDKHQDELVRAGIGVPQVCLAAKKYGAGAFHRFPLTLAEWDSNRSLPKLERMEADDAIQSVAPGQPAIPGGSDAPGQPADPSGSDAPRQPAVPNQSVCPATAQHKPIGAQSMRALLQVRDVFYTYSKRKRDKDVLRGVSFELGYGEFVALLGENGAGKSTLSRMLIKQFAPRSGMISFEGKPLAEWDDTDLFARIGYVFQNPEHQFITDTVEQELAYGLVQSGASRSDWLPRVEEQMQRFGLTPYRNRHPFQLSQGQKRRLSVATMLMNDQPLIVLDEPTFGQDQTHTDHMMHLMRQLQREGKTIFMITHDLELVRQYTSRVLVLYNGHIEYDGSPHDLFADDDRIAAFKLKKPLSLSLHERMHMHYRVPDRNRGSQENGGEVERERRSITDADVLSRS